MKQPKRLNEAEKAYLRQCQLDLRDGLVSWMEYHVSLYRIWGVN